MAFKNTYAGRAFAVFFVVGPARVRACTLSIRHLLELVLALYTRILLGAPPRIYLPTYPSIGLFFHSLFLSVGPLTHAPRPPTTPDPPQYPIPVAITPAAHLRKSGYLFVSFRCERLPH